MKRIKLNGISLDKINLRKGGHTQSEIRTGKAVCVMEAINYIQGRPEYTDAPVCVASTLTDFMQNFNDGVSPKKRQELKYLIPDLIGTRPTIKAIELDYVYDDNNREAEKAVEILRAAPHFDEIADRIIFNTFKYELAPWLIENFIAPHSASNWKGFLSGLRKSKPPVSKYKEQGRYAMGLEEEINAEEAGKGKGFATKKMLDETGLLSVTHMINELSGYNELFEYVAVPKDRVDELSQRVEDFIRTCAKRLQKEAKAYAKKNRLHIPLVKIEVEETSEEKSNQEALL